jgi:hypothetical protein
MSTTNPSTRSPRLLKAVLLGGLVGGLGDITFAILLAASNGMAPMRLLQVVATGAFGRPALSGGLPMAAAGLGFHFILSLIWAGVFVALASRFAILTRHVIVSAIAYGIVVFLAMRLVVLPLSAFPFPVTFKPLPSFLDLLSHVFLFALPIAWFARRGLAAKGADAI